MTELRPAIEVAHQLERDAFVCEDIYDAAHFNIDDAATIITADCRAVVDAIVAMLREEARRDKRSVRGTWLNRASHLIAQRFGGTP